MKYECHGHIILDGNDYAGATKRHKNGPDESFIRHNLKILRDSGIGYYRDGGDKYHVCAFARKIADEYGIHFRTPIFAIYKKGGYGAMFGRSFESTSEMGSLILHAKEMGADFIKLMVSGIMNFKTDGSISAPSLNYDEIREAVKIAEGEGMSVMAHVNGAVDVKFALEAGVKSIEHGYWTDTETIDIFLQTGAVWVPTISPVRNLLGSGIFSDSVLMNILKSQKSILVHAYACGVPIASGSDSGSFMVRQGVGTLNEYGYLEALGINPERGNRLIAEKF